MRTLKSTMLALAALAATPLGAQEITLYSGRGETLVAPLIESFTRETGIEVAVRYGGTAELAILLQEEGDRSPADLFWAQDVAALGTVTPMFTELPAATLARVEAVYRDAGGRWIGTSGRARVLIHAPDRLPQDALPRTMAELTEPRFRGRLAVAPTNGSFIAHVAALRVDQGDAATLAWLRGLADNDPVIVGNNTAGYQAIADGEADLMMTNHYYLGRFLASDPEFPVAQALFQDGDIGNLMMTAGIGVLATSDEQAAAAAFVDYLLAAPAQQYFTGTVYEFPVTGAGIVPVTGMGVSFEAATAAAPAFDLNRIVDMEGTLGLIREAGLI